VAEGGEGEAEAEAGKGSEGAGALRSGAEGGVMQGEGRGDVVLRRRRRRVCRIGTVSALGGKAKGVARPAGALGSVGLGGGGGGLFQPGACL